MVCLNGANKVESKLVVANEQDVQKEGEAEERRARSSHDQSTQKVISLLSFSPLPIDSGQR